MDYARAHNGAGENKRDYIDIFLLLLLILCFSFETLRFFMRLSCFLRADSGALAGPSLPNDAFVETSAPCSKAELQPADPAIYNLTMSSCN